jgi:hypothetical protein
MLPFFCFDFIRYAPPDALIGLLFGYVFAQAVLLAEDRRFRFLMLLTTLPFLFLIKQSGYGLAWLFLGFLALEWLREDGVRGRADARGRLLPGAGALALLALAVASVHAIWAWLVKSHDIAGRFNSLPVTLKTIMQGIEFNEPERAGLVSRNLMEMFFGSPTLAMGPLTFSFFSFLIGAAVWLYVSARQQEEGLLRRNMRAAAAALGLGGLIYTGTLLIYYIHSDFSDREAIALAGFSRYMNTYVLAVLFFGAALAAGIRGAGGKITLLTVFLLAPLMTPGPHFGKLIDLATLRHPKSVEKDRVRYEVARQLCHSAFRSGGRYAVVSQPPTDAGDRTGFSAHDMMNYYLGLGRFRQERIEPFLDRQAPVPRLWKFASTLDFLYVLTPDTRFVEAYAALIEGGREAILPDRLYRATTNRQFRLQPIQQIALDFETLDMLNKPTLKWAEARVSTGHARTGRHALNVALLPQGKAVLTFSRIPQLPQLELSAVSFSLFGDHRQSLCELGSLRGTSVLWRASCDWDGWKDVSVPVPPGFDAEGLAFTFQTGSRKADLWVDDLVLHPGPGGEGTP